MPLTLILEVDHYHFMNRFSLCGIGVAAVLLGGCQTTKVGPNALRSFHGAYNQAITATAEEQLLQNIVRLRYRDNPVFVEVGEITQTNKLVGKGSFGFDKIIMNADKAYVGTSKNSMGLDSENSSIIKIQQLKGKEFVRKLLTPIQPAIVWSMVESGWRPERVFNLCVERINDLYNAQTAGGPTPRFAPEYKNYYRWTELFTRLYRGHVINFGDKPGTNFSDMHMVLKSDPVFAKEIAEFKALAGLKKDANWFKIKDNFVDMSPSKLTIRCRTLLSMFFFLSQGVDVPQADKDRGLVTTTKNLDGSVFDWSDISNRLLNVHYFEGKVCPKGVYVACQYRGKWFFIKDDDSESKATFLLMSQIFTLQSAATYKQTSPTLVVSGS